jgi:hypothetical protein
MKIITVEVQPDHLETIARVKRPLVAVAELIWNGLDADATLIDVELQRNQMEGLTRVLVSDNGHGLPYEDADGAFQKLGGSWKKNALKTKGKGRMLHGRLGRGRFKAFAIGTSIIWNTRYRDNGGMSEYTIRGSSSKIGTFEVGDVAKAKSKKSGTDVDVALAKNFSSLNGDQACNEIAEEFAPYLLQYPDVKITYDGRKVDPSALFRNVADYDLGTIEIPDHGPTIAHLSVIEWNQTTDRALFLCDENGVALHKVTVGIHAPGFEFTACLKSPLIRELDAEGNLIFEEIDPSLNLLIEAARSTLREHFRRRAAETTVELVENWKKEKIYPYLGEPKDFVEAVERQVFDVVALNVNSYLPDFERSENRSKKLSLQLIRQALERDPGELQSILDDVLNLPAEKRKDLAELLKKTSLVSIINASKVVADRLNFVRGLEVLVFDEESKEVLLETQQLHRILATETWIFGEQFNISVDDESLDEVLAKHLKLLGRSANDDAPVLREDGRSGRVDLMLSKRIPLPDQKEREHLVVELKRPRRKIDLEVHNQIVSYAEAVSRDERFRDTATTWHFWAVSNEMENSVRKLANQKNRASGMILEDGEKQVFVWAKTWGEIIHDCKARLEFFQQRLNFQADRVSALDYLRGIHQKYIPAILK